MSDILIVLLFMLIINLLLIAWSITDLMQRKQVRLLSKTGWIIVIALVVFGSVPYLLFGRPRDPPRGNNHACPD